MSNDRLAVAAIGTKLAELRAKSGATDAAIAEDVAAIYKLTAESILPDMLKQAAKTPQELLAKVHSLHAASQAGVAIQPSWLELVEKDAKRLGGTAGSYTGSISVGGL